MTGNHLETLLITIKKERNPHGERLAAVVTDNANNVVFECHGSSQEDVMQAVIGEVKAVCAVDHETAPPDPGRLVAAA